jgi:hypothetical protein
MGVVLLILADRTSANRVEASGASHSMQNIGQAAIKELNIVFAAPH